MIQHCIAGYCFNPRVFLDFFSDDASFRLIILAILVEI